MRYIGYTMNLEKRLRDHADGKTKSTAPRRPFDLIYCEFHTSKSDAMRRERYFKTDSGRRTLTLMTRGGHCTL